VKAPEIEQAEKAISKVATHSDSFITGAVTKLHGAWCSTH
jgi:hypothetical protein